jgi:predicted aconitase with swiveling domain
MSARPSPSPILGQVEIRGTTEGEILKLTKPISFWGGVDAKTGRISDPRHPQHDVSISGKILVLPGMIGSSSASYVLTELMMEKLGPAALVIPEADAILPLAVIVAREMGWGSIPVIRLPVAKQAALETGARARIAEDGWIEVG